MHYDIMIFYKQKEKSDCYDYIINIYITDKIYTNNILLIIFIKAILG